MGCHSITAQELRRLQLVQNTAARMVACTKRTEHIKPVLRRLHWLPLKVYRLQSAVPGIQLLQWFSSTVPPDSSFPTLNHQAPLFSVTIMPACSKCGEEAHEEADDLSLLKLCSKALECSPAGSERMQFLNSLLQRGENSPILSGVLNWCIDCCPVSFSFCFPFFSPSISFRLFHFLFDTIAAP